MININSPTVQSMLNNTPQGVGNMPTYTGPTVTTETYTIPNGIWNPSIGQQMPYPSPREMVTQMGRSNIYSPSTFAPINIVGAANPGYNAAFSNYSNPYMGQGSYGGISNPYAPYQPPIYTQGYQSIYPQYQSYTPYQQPIYPGFGYIPAPIDEQSSLILECCMLSGLTYDEQLRHTSNIMKRISRIVSHNIGRSEEEAKRFESDYDIIPKFIPVESIDIPYSGLNGITCQIVKGDEVIYSTVIKNNFIDNSCILEVRSIERNMWIRKQEQELIYRRNVYLNSTSPMRSIDNLGLAEFFTSNAVVEAFSKELNDYYNRRIVYNNISSVYDKKSFKERLTIGSITSEQVSAMGRFAGRYGVMPCGREVYPSHDPSVASSFSYDPSTGKCHITAPGFIQDRLNRAREQFMRSIDTNNDQ